MINYTAKVNERLVGATITNEPHVIGTVGVATSAPGFVRLVEVPQAPSPLSTVSIPGYNEIMSGSPTGTQFLVDYTTGVITFNVAQDGNSILVSYIGLGSEFAAEDVNELQGPVGVALNYNGSLSSNIVKPASISNTATDDFTFPRDVIVTRNLRTLELTSASANPASSGVVRLANAIDSISWRNFTNSADLALTVNTSNQLTFNGVPIETNTLTNSHIFVGNASNVATDTVLSGDATLSNTGVLTLNTVTVSKGGTGLTTLTAHNVLLGEGTSNVAFAAPGTSGYPLLSTGASSDPSFGQLSLTVGVTGTLPIANGGTNNTSYTTGSIIYYNGTSLFQDNTNLFWNGTTHQLGVGTNTPNASALVDMESTTQGFLPPQMTSTQRTAISSPAAGLIVYDTTTNQLYLWNGSSWVILG